MKLTVEIPDALHQKVKVYAAKHRTTIQKMVEVGLRLRLDVRQEERLTRELVQQLAKAGLRPR